MWFAQLSLLSSVLVITKDTLQLRLPMNKLSLVVLFNMFIQLMNASHEIKQSGITAKMS